VSCRTSPSDPPVDKDDPDAYAACACQPEYFRATLYFDPYHKSWATKENGTVEACVRHEVLHIVVGTLACLGRELLDDDEKAQQALTFAEEQVVTMLEHMPVWD